MTGMTPGSLMVGVCGMTNHTVFQKTRSDSVHQFVLLFITKTFTKRKEEQLTEWESVASSTLASRMNRTIPAAPVHFGFLNHPH